MSRGKTQLEFLLELPWWLNALFGAVGYVILKWVAPAILIHVLPQTKLFPINKIFAQGVSQFSIFALILFGMITLLSIIWHVQRGTFFRRNANPKAIQAMNWQNFEILISECYKRQGYKVEEIGGGGPDGGVDLILRKEGEKILVQCKHWKAFKVGVSILREFYGVMVDAGASQGVIVTSGDFTPDALDFVQDKPIKLINGGELSRMLSSSGPNKSLPQFVIHAETIQTQESEPSQLSKKKYDERDYMPPEMRQKLSGVAQEFAEETPICPTCKVPMVLRTAKKGPYPGSKFWGCINYPHCKQTQPYPYWD